MHNNMTYYEEHFLSPYAQKSNHSRGRAIFTEPSPVRTEYQRDRDRILHSKSFRRLKHKTQVFLSPEGDHYRTRLTHTLEVSQIGRTIARALRLNEDLVEAISLGHDLGHTPFGHAGEGVLNKLNPAGFQHNKHSLRVVELLENDGQGLNLTYEVRDGILHHKKTGNPSTLEGKIVSYADRIAYINHDIEDAISARILVDEDIPADLRAVLGNTKGERINRLIIDIIEHSIDKDKVSLSPNIETAMDNLRKFMFLRVYNNNDAKLEESKALVMIEVLYNYYLTNTDKLPLFYQNNLPLYGAHDCVTDYVASMTDRYAVNEFTKIFIPKSWNG